MFEHEGEYLNNHCPFELLMKCFPLLEAPSPYYLHYSIWCSRITVRDCQFVASSVHTFLLGDQSNVRVGLRRSELTRCCKTNEASSSLIFSIWWSGATGDHRIATSVPAVHLFVDYALFVHRAHHFGETNWFTAHSGGFLWFLGHRSVAVCECTVNYLVRVIGCPLKGLTHSEGASV